MVWTVGTKELRGILCEDELEAGAWKWPLLAIVGSSWVVAKGCKSEA